MEIQRIFPDKFRAKPYRVLLYSMESGWRSETRTLIVDEARGLCKIEYDKTTVNNSHGTDVDYELYCTGDYTLEQMADLLEKEYRNVMITPKLRELGTIFDSVQSVGQAFLHEHLPEYEIVKLRYASSSTAIFEAKRKSEENIIIKMSKIPKVRKDSVDSVFDRVMKLEGSNNLLPIYSKLWVPYDANHEVQIVLHPVMETIGTERRRFSRGLSYKSIVQTTLSKL